MLYSEQAAYAHRLCGKPDSAATYTPSCGSDSVNACSSCITCIIQAPGLPKLFYKSRQNRYLLSPVCLSSRNTSFTPADISLSSPTVASPENPTPMDLAIQMNIYLLRAPLSVFPRRSRTRGRAPYGLFLRIPLPAIFSLRRALRRFQSFFAPSLFFLPVF